MASRTDTIDAGNGKTFNAYVAIPARPNGHAVIVLQEIFGVTPAIRGVADRFAEDGYLAFAPDLFWRAAPGIELSHSKDDMAKAFELLGGYKDDYAMADIEATARHVRGTAGFRGKVAVAGLCLGGKLAYLAAARSDVDAAVGYYGVGIEKYLATDAPKRPLQLHFGDRDQYAPVEAQRQIAGAIAGRRDAEMYTYPGADHGFYTRGAPEDINLARERTNAFLQRVLSGSSR